MTPLARIDDAEQISIEQQHRNRDHLRRGFDFSERADSHRFRGTELRHPFAQRRDRNLAADDDERCNRMHAIKMHQHQQGAGDHQFIRHRIEEGSEGGGLVPAARQEAIEPVGRGGDDENDRRGDTLLVTRQPDFRHIKHADYQWNQGDTQPGKQNGNIEWHTFIYYRELLREVKFTEIVSEPPSKTCKDEKSSAAAAHIGLRRNSNAAGDKSLPPRYARCPPPTPTRRCWHQPSRANHQNAPTVFGDAWRQCLRFLPAARSAGPWRVWRACR